MNEASSSCTCAGGWRFASATILWPAATHFIIAYVESLPPETSATTSTPIARADDPRARDDEADTDHDDVEV